MVADRVRQVVVFYSKDWTGICLGRLSIAPFTEVDILTGLAVML